MQLLTALVTLFGTTGVTALIAALSSRKWEARRLSRTIAANRDALDLVPPGVQGEMNRALAADGFRLASLTVVRFRRIITHLAALAFLVVVLLVGALLASISRPTGQKNGSNETSPPLRYYDLIETSFAAEPVESWLIAAGLVVALLAVAVAVVYFRLALLRAGRDEYVRENLIRVYAASAPHQRSVSYGRNRLVDPVALPGDISRRGQSRAAIRYAQVGETLRHWIFERY